MKGTGLLLLLCSVFMGTELGARYEREYSSEELARREMITRTRDSRGASGPRGPTSSLSVDTFSGPSCFIKHCYPSFKMPPK